MENGYRRELQAHADVQPREGFCRVVMSVESRGRTLWKSDRELPVTDDFDPRAMSRLASETAAAIADHLQRRPWLRVLKPEA